MINFLTKKKLQHHKHLRIQTNYFHRPFSARLETHSDRADIEFAKFQPNIFFFRKKHTFFFRILLVAVQRGRPSPRLLSPDGAITHGGVTRFFRRKHHWRTLGHRIHPTFRVEGLQKSPERNNFQWWLFYAATASSKMSHNQLDWRIVRLLIGKFVGFHLICIWRKTI